MLPETDIKHRGRKGGRRKNEFSWKESEHGDGEEELGYNYCI
jgi:hypothetical protein